ncbi:MAG: DNA-processing protein DprA [Oscillospiraceae bacterium]|nr:DNA-processing protein DprA [Oscillospiraceae bacterium]
MTARERGFLLLTSPLGDPNRKPLSVAQFRTLADRAEKMDQPMEDRELCAADLMKLGYDMQMAERIVCLLEGNAALQRYVSRGRQLDCIPVTRVSQAYPYAVRKRLGLDAPGCLWAKGDLNILSSQTISLVGSRDIMSNNRIFAEMAGYEAARQGITLVSGDARGADRAAQEACLASGGKVICVVADELYKYPIRKNVLYLSEDSYDLPFSSQRALSRNRVIHALGYLTLVAQCTAGAGGTWDGTTRNLRNGWSPVFCFDDGSAASLELQQLGATLLKTEQLSNMAALQPDIQKLI